MIDVTPQSDDLLRARLARLSMLDKDYWSFKENSRREHGHGLFQYPAMMVPQMVEAMLDEICAVHPEIEWVSDPFTGSGTILTESMLKGLCFVGRDVNPLAVLLCRTKAGPFFSRALHESRERLLVRIRADRKQRVEISFPGIRKWFRKDVQVGLSRIRRSIRQEKCLWIRRVFWVALAETVRLTSNSRTSTFKLHTRPAAEVRSRRVDAIGVFERTLTRNVRHLDDFLRLLRERKLTKRGLYTRRVIISLGDSRESVPLTNEMCDILITSPPYGDNVSTVPYGQFSFLPLQWIDLQDIDPRAKADYLRTTHEIDSRSLGGRRRMDATLRDSLIARSPTLQRLLVRLAGEPPDRRQRVTAFFRDLNACLPQAVLALRKGGLMIWVLGNRRVAGKPVPLDRIVGELLEHHGVSRVAQLTRRISSKRMPLKNSIAKTMSAESILVMRRTA